MRINHTNFSFEFNEDGVCTLPDCQVIQLFKQVIIENPVKYLGQTGAEVSTVNGSVTGSQDIGRTFRFVVQGNGQFGSKTVYIKLCPKWERLDPAKMEYEIIEFLHEKMPAYNGRFGVARPIEYYPELNSYAQESVGVSTLRRLLLKANSKNAKDSEFQILCEKVKESTQWLFAFHDITKSSLIGKFSYQEFLASLDYEFKITHLKNFRFKQETLATIHECFERIKELDGLAIPLARFHFDYTPAHIFIDKGIHVIDIIGTENIPIFEDIGRFIASLVSVNSFPLYPFFDYKRARNILVDVVLKSYLHGSEHENNEFSLMANCYFLKHLCVWFGAQSQRVSSRTNNSLGRLFTNTRLVSIFEPAMLQAAFVVNTLLKK